jgi:hypothetical protein
LAPRRRRISLVSAIKREIRQAQKIRLPVWSYVPLISASFLVCWAFDEVGKFNMALPAMNAVAVFAFLLVLKRNLLRRGWFWAVMSVFAALHVAVVLLVPWTDKWVPALVIGGIGSLDIVAILAVLVVTARALGEDVPVE